MSRDLEKAAQWYEKAAIQGHPEAKYNLAVMLWNAEGVARNVAKAQRLLVESAESGEVSAIRVLAESFERGHFGFSVDPSRAGYWRRKYEESIS